MIKIILTQQQQQSLLQLLDISVKAAGIQVASVAVELALLIQNGEILKDFEEVNSG